MIKHLIAALALMAATNALGADLSERLEGVVKAQSPASGFMGAVLVAKGGKVLLSKGYGSADLEWSIPNAPDVKYRLGSLTKQFTSALVLILQQDGKLDINDPISKHLPDAPAGWKAITVKNLLEHTSGIPDFTDAPEFETWRMTPHDWSTAWRGLDKPLEFAPGARFSYSNSNYELLGVILERAGGASYADQLRTRILEPLGLKDTGLDQDGLILPRPAQGYELQGERIIASRSESMSVPWAAGSMYSTTGDLLKWEMALFLGKVVTPASLRLMTTPSPVSLTTKGDAKSGYALGLGVAEKPGRRIIGHSGGIEGFNTALTHAVEQDITVVVLANRSGDEPDKIAKALMKTLLDEPSR